MSAPKTEKPRRPSLTLPAGWKDAVNSAMLRAIALARYALTQARAETCDDAPPKVPPPCSCRCHAENERLQQEVSLLREEMRIKDDRMTELPPHKRPRYSPMQRMDILQLRAARAWSLEQTARAMLVTAATVSSWLKRVDEQGSDALVQLCEPVNKFPAFVGALVRRLKTHYPTMGKAKIAQTLARAGLHLGATTVGRMLAADPCADKPGPAPTDKPGPAPTDKPGPATTDKTGPATTAEAAPPAVKTGSKPQAVTAKRPNHVWHVDLTIVPIGGGLWVPWLPLALPQCWPFCWWVAVVVDHHSRRVMGVAKFAKQPTSVDVRAFLARAIRAAGAVPKYIICDRGTQFDCAGFRAWCERRGVKPRYGAIGKHGSIAVVERLIRTLKETLRRLTLVPLLARKFRQELANAVEWYNEHRPHETLGGRTPNEVYHHRFPANRRPRYEPRQRWPRGSPCANPWALTRGRTGARLELDVTYHAGRRHLPIVTLQLAA